MTDCRRAARYRLALCASSVALGIVACSAAPAFAVDEAPPSHVDEVVVVGMPLDAAGVSLSRTPANAVNVDVGAARERGAGNLADVLNANVGSASVSNGTGNPYQNDVNYRGFQATSVLGSPVSLAVYFDGVRVNEPFGAIVNWDLIPINAITSVSVQPGSNPIFGLNALGGALVVSTPNGEDNRGVGVSLLGGSFGRGAATFEVGGADARTRTDVFVSGNYDRQDGFRRFSGSEVKQVYAKARWHGPGDRTLVELSGAFADTSLRGTQSLPLDRLAAPQAAYTAPDVIADQMRLINLKARYSLDATNDLVARIYARQSNASNLNSNVHLDDGCFNADGSLATNASGFACANQAPSGTAPNAVTDANALALGYGRWTGSINSSLVTSFVRQTTVGASAQWASATPLFDHKNAFVLGGAFDQSNIGYQQNTYLARLIDYQTLVIPNQEYGFTANGLAPSAANLPKFTGSNILSAVTFGARLQETSVFVTDMIDVTNKLSVTASGGYDATSIDQGGVNSRFLNNDGGFVFTDAVSGVTYYNPAYSNAFTFANTGGGAATSPTGVPAGAVAGPETNSLAGAHRYQRFNPRIGVNYNVDPSLGFFGGYSESMRAPTSIELSCADPNRPCALPTGFNGDPDLKAVTARTFEIGARGKLFGIIVWNAAAYDARLRNDIQFISTSSTYGYFFNVGDTERRGAELGAEILREKVSLAANYGYVEAVYRSPFTTAGGEDVASGDKIPGIPSQTFKLRAGYALTDNLRLGASLVAASAQYAHGNENNADPGGKVAGYAVVGLDAQYRIGKSLTVNLAIDNLFDQKYATFGLAGVTSIYNLVTQQFQTPAPPRGVWLKIAYALGPS